MVRALENVVSRSENHFEPDNKGSCRLIPGASGAGRALPELRTAYADASVAHAWIQD